MPLLRHAFSKPVQFQLDQLLLVLDHLELDASMHRIDAAVRALCAHICKHDSDEVRDAFLAVALRPVQASRGGKRKAFEDSVTAAVVADLPGNDVEFGDIQEAMAKRNQTIKENYWNYLSRKITARRKLAQKKLKIKAGVPRVRAASSLTVVWPLAFIFVVLVSFTLLLHCCL